MFLHPFKNKILLFVLIVFCWIGVGNFCFANALETQVSSDRVTLGDSVFVTYIANNNTSHNSPDFTALQNDFRILNSNFGNTVNMINGVTSIQTFWRFQLEPKRVGDLMIPEINFGNDKSTAHKLVVTSGQVIQNAKTIAANAKQGLPVFVRGEINTSAPYVQSQVLYTFKLYFRTQLREPRVDIPQMTDAILLPLADRPGYQTTVNGKVYNVVEKTIAIFPKKPGVIIIPSMAFHAFTIDEDINAFDDLFNFYEPKAISVATNEVNVSVRDIPPNYPGSAWLPAKNISLTDQWSDNSRHWESGTPVTRTITLEAQGLRADQLPDISIDKINGVNVYVDRPKRSNNVQNDRVIGTLEQKVTYIPSATQSFSITPIKINWWDTQTDSNKVAQLSGMSVQVKGFVGLSNPPTNAAFSPALSLANTAITTTQKTKIVSHAFNISIWFWIACVLLAAWAVTLWTLLGKKSVTTNEIPIQTHKPIEISDKNFAQACHAGQAIQAQQYLLSWAKKQWPDITFNLATLREKINDEPFQLAMHELEQVLYARQSAAWNGQTLLSTFQRIKKTRKYLASSDTNFNNLPLSTDPLPPLNPS